MKSLKRFWLANFGQLKRWFLYQWIGCFEKSLIEVDFPFTMPKKNRLMSLKFCLFTVFCILERLVFCDFKWVFKSLIMCFNVKNKLKMGYLNLKTWTLVFSSPEVTKEYYRKQQVICHNWCPIIYYKKKKKKRSRQHLKNAWQCGSGCFSNNFSCW
jgi:hypothetical protein